MLFIELKKTFPARSLEWWSSALLASWGAYVILHPGLFKTPDYQGLTILMDQNTWGLGAFAAGITRLFALYVNGSHTRTPAIRLIVAFASVFVWFWISVGLWRSGVPQMGMIIYPWLMLADMYSAHRAASDAVEAEHQRRLEALTEANAHVVSSIRRG